MKDEHGMTMAEGDHRARGSWFKAGGCLRRWTDPEGLPCIEDGPQLAPMHLLHGPRGALLATLPQWPRIKPFTCSQYRQAGHRCHSPSC